MKYLCVFFLLASSLIIFAEEEPLPQWLKVYQQTSPMEFHDRSISRSNEITVELHIESVASDQQSSSEPTLSLNDSIAKQFPSKLRLRDYIREQFKAGRYTQVLPYLKEIIRREPEHTEMLYKMAYSLRKTKNWQESLVFYDIVIDKKPDFKDVWYERALVLRELNRFQEALEGFERSLKFNPRASWVYYDQGILLKRMKRYQESIASFTKGLEFRPEHSWTYLELGNIFYSRGQYVHAMNYYRKTLDLNPTAPGVEQNLKICIRRLEGK